MFLLNTKSFQFSVEKSLLMFVGIEFEGLSESSSNSSFLFFTVKETSSLFFRFCCKSSPHDPSFFGVDF